MVKGLCLFRYIWNVYIFLVSSSLDFLKFAFVSEGSGCEMS